MLTMGIEGERWLLFLGSLCANSHSGEGDGCYPDVERECGVASFGPVRYFCHGHY